MELRLTYSPATLNATLTECELFFGAAANGTRVVGVLDDPLDEQRPDALYDMLGYVYVHEGTGAQPPRSLSEASCSAVDLDGTRQTLSGPALISLLCSNGGCLLPLNGSGDAASPVITAFSAVPAAIHTSASDARVMLTAAVSDDWSGAFSCSVTLAFAPAANIVETNGTEGVREALTTTLVVNPPSPLKPRMPTTVNVSGELVVPAFWPQGNFTVQSLTCTDRVGNSGSASAGTLSSTLIQQAGVGDATVPTISGLTTTVRQVNTSTASASIPVAVAAVDAGSGKATDSKRKKGGLAVAKEIRAQDSKVKVEGGSSKWTR